ncbi:nucleotidyltransferase family protein [Paenibacillus contaminans]|uniref:Nucleotidyltransferase family protein n=1 Tax=Paenibacillus contaminans TaxID=450362 RepID=A0A329MQQ2_9BACL|nr:nucleotidyltransferase family protein [Paenibacillus contaminans]RAV22104.1 hypothetical protein DQG23_08710 [Paenibacillus contaminans]
MLVEFLQALYTRRPFHTENQETYKTIACEMKKAAVAPQLFTLMKHTGSLEKAPDFFLRELRHAYELTVYQNLFLLSEEQRIRNCFESNKIEVIPLKGTRFAERVFGDFAARGTGDIDLLVRTSQMPSAIAYLQALGYTQDDEQAKDHFHLTFSKPLESSNESVCVELHWNLVKERTSRLRIEEFWHDAACLKGFIFNKELSVQHTFHAICLHGANHYMDSLKHVLDIVQMIEKFADEIDMDKLLQDARRDLHFTKVRFALSSAYRTFPHLQAIKPVQLDETSRFWKYVTTRNKSNEYPSFLYLVFFSAAKIWLHDRWSYRFRSIREWFSEQRSKRRTARAFYRRQGKPGAGPAELHK